MTGYVTNEPQNNGANMSQNRCGYCWNYGHNRTTCPSMKKNYEEAVAKQNTDEDLTYRQSRALQEYPTIQAKKKVGRRCSYCYGGGHRITTCSSRKKHIAQYEQLRTIWQEQVTCVLKKHGIGHGAIVTEEVWKSINNTYEKVRQPFMVVNLNPDALGIIDLVRYVSHTENPHRMSCVPLDNPTQRRWVMVPYSILNELSSLLKEQIQDDNIRFHKWGSHIGTEDVLVAPSTSSVVAPALTKATRKGLFKGDTLAAGKTMGRVHDALVKNGGTFFGHKIT
jgi:hypothetical protein